MKVPLSELIDRLSILNIKIWHYEDALRDENKSDAELGQITRVLTKASVQRSEIKTEIDNQWGEGQSDLKIYAHHEVNLLNQHKGDDNVNRSGFAGDSKV